jgi:hypothetical protein
MITIAAASLLTQPENAFVTSYNAKLVLLDAVARLR